MAVLVTGCSGGGSAPRSLPPLSTTPAAVSSNAPPSSKAADLAAVKAVVRRYYALLNSPTTVANADALAALMTADCKCRRVADSTREVAERGQHYFGKTHVVAIRAVLDTRDSAEALVQYNVGTSGIETAAGRRLTVYPALHGAKVNFLLRRDGAHWRIRALVYIKPINP